MYPFTCCVGVVRGGIWSYYLKLFDFQLEKSNIALSPVSPRDNSKLLVLDENESIGNAHFYDLPSFLNPGYTLVVNETKVIPSYFECFKKRSD